MTKTTNWYLEGWEYREQIGKNGKPKKVLVYTGKYYTLGPDKKKRRRLKTAVLALGLLAVALLAFLGIWGCGGLETIYVGAPFYVTILPAIYILMGSVVYAWAPEEMTYRDLCASERRLKRSTTFAAVLLGISVAGQVVFVILTASGVCSGEVGRELLWLGGDALCFAAVLTLCLLTRRFPAKIVKKK